MNPPTSSLTDTDIQDLSTYLQTAMQVSGLINNEEAIPIADRIMTPESVTALNDLLQKNLAAINCIVTNSSCQSSV